MIWLLENVFLQDVAMVRDFAAFFIRCILFLCCKLCVGRQSHQEIPASNPVARLWRTHRAANNLKQSRAAGF